MTKSKVICVRPDQYNEFLKILINFEFQSSREAFDFLLFLARKYGGIEYRRWRKKVLEG